MGNEVFVDFGGNGGTRFAAGEGLLIEGSTTPCQRRGNLRGLRGSGRGENFGSADEYIGGGEALIGFGFFNQRKRGQRVEGRELGAGEGASEVVHRPTGLEEGGLGLVDIVEEEDAFAELGDEGVEG